MSDDESNNNFHRFTTQQAFYSQIRLINAIVELNPTRSSPRKRCHQKSCDHSNSEKAHHPLNQISFDYLRKREHGRLSYPEEAFQDMVAHRLPHLLKEKEYQLGGINKIFTAAWLNDNQVVFGTKCNKLTVMDVRTGQQTVIPSLKSSPQSKPAKCPCGIHGLSVNPSKTMLATGAAFTNDLAVYSLPTFDPVCTGEGAHEDWIFDMEWLDDNFIVTGSRDTVVALWKVEEPDSCDSRPRKRLKCQLDHTTIKPLCAQTADSASRVRALAVDHDKKQLGVLSLNAHFHLWDLEKFEQFNSQRLKCTKENVCMTCCKDRGLYAIGSQSNVTLLDPRVKGFAGQTVISSQHRERGIRSVSFNNDILTIGTGVGIILFYDVKAGAYLQSDCMHVCQKQIGKGFVRQDENFRTYFFDSDYPHAIYTHCYDPSRTRLFAAGGPLPAGLWGNYAGLYY